MRITRRDSPWPIVRNTMLAVHAVVPNGDRAAFFNGLPLLNQQRRRQMESPQIPARMEERFTAVATFAK